MKTLGIGVDIIENSRIKNLYLIKGFYLGFIQFMKSIILKNSLIKLVFFLKDLRQKRHFLKL